MNNPIDSTGVLDRLRRFDPERWRQGGPAEIERGEAAVREVLRADPENVDAVHELAMVDWLAGRRRAAIVRLRKVAKLDPARAREVDEQIASIEAEESRILSAKYTRELEQEEAEAARAAEVAERRAAVRAEAGERSLRRAERSVAKQRPDLDQAVRFWKPTAGVGVAVAFFVFKLVVGCSAEADDDSQPVRPDAPITQTTQTALDRQRQQQQLLRDIEQYASRTPIPPVPAPR
ncbi:hypothetical protein [Nocardia jejuensis]|uniref:hypothetical protein n=1 Tax=Nocardia jejuensis TaxID=328049 RepID=UPI00083132D0|nr:hypothetical protein [Nocardia jejuensis]